MVALALLVTERLWALVALLLELSIARPPVLVRIPLLVIVAVPTELLVVSHVTATPEGCRFPVEAIVPVSPLLSVFPLVSLPETEKLVISRLPFQPAPFRVGWKLEVVNHSQ